MSELRQLLVSSGAYETRTETFEGREYLVVPVVALVETVVHAMNAKNPELVTAEEFSKGFTSWDGRPVYHGHPMRDGKPVSGNTPAVLETECVGIVFNTAIKKSKLAMEAWLDVARCEEIAPALLKRAQAGDPIEISVGAFVGLEVASGTFDGKEYDGSWSDIKPDHLALLPEGDEGACSRKAGCGVRAAAQRPEGGEMSDKKIDKTNGTLFARMMSMFRSAQSPDEMSSSDLYGKLGAALRVIEPNFNWVEAYRPVIDPTTVIYTCYEYSNGYNYTMYSRGFSLSSEGAVTLADSRAKVEAVVNYELVAAADAAPGAVPNTATGAPCSCKDKHEAPLTAAAAAQETETMKLEDVITALGSATPEQKAALRTALGTEPAVVETPAPVAAAAAPVATEQPKAVTLKDLVANADQDTRDAFAETQRVAAEKRTATITALKETGRCPYSDEQLATLSQVDLSNLVKLAGVAQPVAASVDYSGQGGPKSLAAGQNAVPAAPDMRAAFSKAESK